MQLSSDILLFIGQKYLKDILCIKKLFYYFEDDELQKILFGEVLYKHKQFKKTTLPLDFFLPNRDNNKWIFNNITPHHKLKNNSLSYMNDYINFVNEIYENVYYGDDDKYQIYLIFEKEKKERLLIKVEYVCLPEPVIYSDEFISYTISHKILSEYIPNVYKTIKKEIYKQIIY